MFYSLTRQDIFFTLFMLCQHFLTYNCKSVTRHGKNRAVQKFRQISGSQKIINGSEFASFFKKAMLACYQKKIEDLPPGGLRTLICGFESMAGRVEDCSGAAGFSSAGAGGGVACFKGSAAAAGG